MKHIISLDIQQRKDWFDFTLHFEKEMSTFKSKDVSSGLKRVDQILKDRENGIRTDNF